MNERKDDPRLKEIDSTLNELQGRQKILEKQWDEERNEINQLKETKSKVENIKKQIEIAERDSQLEVGPEVIAEVVAKWTGIPVDKMVQSETQKLLKMEELLGKRVVGQQDALAAVSNAIRRARAEIGDPTAQWGPFYS